MHLKHLFQLYKKTILQKLFSFIILCDSCHIADIGSLYQTSMQDLEVVHLITNKHLVSKQWCSDFKKKSINTKILEINKKKSLKNSINIKK